MKWYLVFPLVASLLYIFGALFVKRAQQLGAGLLRTTFLSNLSVALIFCALLPLGGKSQPWSAFWQPAIVAVLLLAGQALSFFALSGGDVSVATPVLGAKTIFVAWFTTLILATHLPWQLWCAAALSFLAIILLNRAPSAPLARGSHRLGFTILYSMLAAISYALFDVLVQKWSPVWGAGRFMPIVCGLSALITLAFVPFFRAPLHAIPRAAWPSLGFGVLFMALQSFSLVAAVSIFGDATAMNVVYSARGVWSVGAVWLIGHWFANTESELGGRILRWRLAGAGLMTAAIVLVVTR